MKNTITGLLVGVILGGGLVWGWFTYVRAPRPNVLPKIEAPISSATEPVADHFLPFTVYDKHTPYEKTLIDRYIAANPEVAGRAQDYLQNNPQGKIGDIVYLKYYDFNSALIGTSVCKDFCFYPMNIYDLHTMKKMSTAYFEDSDNAFQNDSYIVTLQNNGQQQSLSYYKRGARDFATVPNSNIEPKNETYVAVGGIGGEAPSIMFTGPNTIVVDVYDPAYSDNGSSTKRLKISEFNLP